MTKTEIELKIKLVEGLAKLMTDYRLDAIDIDGVKIVKSQHAIQDIKKALASEEDDDMFYSSEG